MKRVFAVLFLILTLCHITYASPLNNVILAHQYESDLTDSHASYDGTCAGCTYDTSTPKLGSGSVVLNGTSDRITTTYQPSSPTALSVSAWGNNDTGAANNGLWGWVSGTNGLMLQTTASGVLLFFGPNGSSYAQYSMTTTGWHHYVVTYDGSQTTNATKLKLYVDGSAKTLNFNASVPASITMPTAFTVGDVGASYGRYWDGKIDEVTVWDRTILASEVTTLYNSGTGLEYPFGLDTVLTFDTIYKAYQRNGTSRDITFSGTYSGSTTPTAIEVQIEDNDGNVEQAYATCDSSPSGGTWSCVKTVNAASDDLIAWARFSNDTSIDFYTPEFIVGDKIAGMGQSLCEYMSTSVSGSDSTAVEGLWVYYLGLDGSSSTWRRPQNRGDVAFLETIAAVDDYAVAFINLCQNTTGLNAAADGGHGTWLDESAGSPWIEAKTALTSIQNSVAAVLWVQGQNDIYYGVSASQYGTDLTTFINRVRSEVGNGSGLSEIPFCVATLAGTSVVDPDVTDTTSNAYRAEQLAAETNNTTTYTYPIVHIPRQDTWHPQANEAGYGQFSKESGQCVLYSLGLATYYRGPSYDTITAVSGISNAIDINLSYPATGGTDFTPTSGISGFTVSGGLSVDGTERIDADTIRIYTDSAITADTTTISYQQGKNPDITAPVVDNTTYTLPLLFFVDVTVASLPSTSSPCAGYPGGSILYCGENGGAILYFPANQYSGGSECVGCTP